MRLFFNSCDYFHAKFNERKAENGSGRNVIDKNNLHPITSQIKE